MRLRINPGEVGDELGILISLRNQEQPVMPLRVIRLSVASGNGDAELERHVEARQLFAALAFASRQIMYGILGRKNRPRDPLHSRLDNIPGLERAARQAASPNRT